MTTQQKRRRLYARPGYAFTEERIDSTTARAYWLRRYAERNTPQADTVTVLPKVA